MKRIFMVVVVFLGFGTAAMACPDYTLWGNETYRLTGQQMYQEQAYRVTAGGQNYIWDCRNIRPGTDTGAGFFTTAPDFSFEISGMGGYQLAISVVSRCDSALLINTSSANWYYDDDDNGNLDPRIVLTRPANGILDVWVGTYDGEYCDAVLSLETFRR
ncbi:MAG: hypothetical protein COB65_13305 [Thalassobium sp.]|nr:MAG: hypothetical protein COB65_13305 [Thalassobium sp.]